MIDQMGNDMIKEIFNASTISYIVDRDLEIHRNTAISLIK